MDDITPTAIQLTARQLTAKQIAFCDAFARGLTKTESARAAGYSSTSRSTLAAMATNNLRNPAVRGLIRQKREIYSRAALVTAADIVDALWGEAQNVGNKGFERVKALELLGRALGMFSDEATKGHPTAPPVTVYIPDNGRPVIDLRMARLLSGCDVGFINCRSSVPLGNAAAWLQ